MSCEFTEKKFLDSFCPYDPKDLNCYVIIVKGKRVAVCSGKYIWNSKHSAKCALSNHISGLRCDCDYRDNNCNRRNQTSKKAWIDKYVQIITLAEYMDLKAKGVL